MTDMLCGYIDRDETIVAFLYGDLDPARRRDFEGHLLTCALCRDEVAGLRGVRTQLARWEPPAVASLQSPVAAHGRQPWWRTIPAWAQVAAALVFFGVAAGIANLDVRYDQRGLTIRTGWSGGSGGLRESNQLDGTEAARPPSRDARFGGPGVSSPVKDAPWRADLAALERQLKTEFHASPVSAPSSHVAPQSIRAASASDADILRRVRALVEESEKRQQRELALRVAEVLRDVSRQRQADLIKIDRNMDLMQNKLGVEVLQQRQSLNYFMRVNQRQ